PVRRNLDVVDPLERIVPCLVGVEVGELVERDDQLRSTGLEIEAMDSVVLGVWLGSESVGATRVAVSRSMGVQPREVHAVSEKTIGGDSVYRLLVHVELSALRVTHDRDESALATVVVHQESFRIGRMPLQHRTLLPVPR